jgi:hypothetical protein
MRRLIERLGIAIITFLLGLFALDLWTTLYPPKIIYPKQMVISEEQYKAVDNPPCYRVVPRRMIVDKNGYRHCVGGEMVRIANCQ